MKNSIVNIESVSNSSFGTGFVIDTDKYGIYILTCQHVLDDVQIPVVDNILAKVIAKGDFIDMAVLYVEKLKLPSLPMQVGAVHNLDVEVIGFSTFNKMLTQKKHINATLYEESIELHSKNNDMFYNVHKIKAKDGFNFDRGNSGSPVICKSSGSVIAMVSNKEGSDLAYAINIENLKTIWKNVPPKLFHKSKKTSPSTQTKKSSFTKYILTSFTIFILGTAIYTFMEKFPSHTVSKKLQDIYTLYILPVENKQAQLEKDREAQLEKDREAQLQKDREAEFEDIRQAKLKRARESELQDLRQAKLKRAREAELQDLRQGKLKRARETELEDIRQAKLKRARETELENIRQAKLKRARETELENIRQAKLKRAREAKLQDIRQAKLKKNIEEKITSLMYTLKKTPVRYKGKVGQLNVIFSISWHESKKVTGTYFYPQRSTTKLYTLKGHNYENGKLYLEEYTNEYLSAKIYLTKSLTQKKVIWKGRMENTNGKFFNIQIQREK